MYVINAENVNDALDQGLRLMAAEGVAVPSRNGMTLELPAPVTTVYKNPAQRVLVSSARDANPFFHLMESLWILAGRDDVKFLSEFNKRMVDFSDDRFIFNAPYGYRLRKAFGQDQLQRVIDILTNDPNSRQAVCQIWDSADLNKDTRDKACNMSIVFRMRNQRLDMTVYNRSNDMIWGAYGANVLQFSMIQEYVAASLGVKMGTYTQVSNSFHVYTEGAAGDVYNRTNTGFQGNFNPYEYCECLVRMSHAGMRFFNQDLKQFFKLYDDFGLVEVNQCSNWRSAYFEDLVMPMLLVYLVHKTEGPVEASKHLKLLVADDWRMACGTWLETRANKGSK
jgi:hypothetical protein